MVKSQAKAIRASAKLPPRNENSDKEPEKDIKVERRALLLFMMVIPLSLALYSFFHSQLARPDWPLLPENIPPRGVIQSRDGTIFAEGDAEHRRYPMNRIAAHIIGFSGKVQEDGSYGLEGIENTLDSKLQTGETVILTIDPRMQTVAQNQLKKVIETYDASNGSVVILEAGTGRILAAASYPEFDPNRQRFVRDRSIIANKAFLYTFEPGSVMKPFVVSAALDSGRWPSDRLLETPMFLRVGQKTFSDVVQHEAWLSLWDVLRYSSNSGMIHLSQNFSDEELYAWLTHLGFGKGLSVPSIFSRAGTLRDTPWFPQDHASITIGQSMSTTTLELAANYSIFANNGMYITPYLVEGDSVPEPQQRLHEDTASAVLTMLRYVVDQSKSLTEAMVPGISVAGKTGTADIFDAKAGEYIKGDYNVTFAGIFPADNPKVTMVVTVQKPRKSGSSTVVAAPLFGAIEHEVAPLLNLGFASSQSR